MEKFLKDLYQRFLVFEKASMVFDWTHNSTSLKKTRIPTSVIKACYDNYYRPSCLDFIRHVKRFVYADSVFEFITGNIQDQWKLHRYLRFLEKEDVIRVTAGGRARVRDKALLNVIPAPQTADRIIGVLERKLRVSFQAKASVLDLFKNRQSFSVKAEWDQLPISQSSAVTVVEKILAEIPLNRKFLFVGDDDFISLLLSLADPTIESLVVDADPHLLRCIDTLAAAFNLKIQTRKMNLMRAVRLGEPFIGFLANPIYTAPGIKKFVSFGLKQLGEDGGVVFLEMGDEAIRNRLLDLQRFFAARRLITTEIVNGKIFYPHLMLYPEDREIFDRLAAMMDKKAIRRSPQLGAALYVFRYLPFKPQPVHFEAPAYAYL
jgi:hypothetical protein